MTIRHGTMVMTINEKKREGERGRENFSSVSSVTQRSEIRRDQSITADGDASCLRAQSFSDGFEHTLSEGISPGFLDVQRKQVWAMTVLCMCS